MTVDQLLSTMPPVSPLLAFQSHLPIGRDVFEIQVPRSVGCGEKVGVESGAHQIQCGMAWWPPSLPLPALFMYCTKACMFCASAHSMLRHTRNVRAAHGLES